MDYQQDFVYRICNLCLLSHCTTQLISLVVTELLQQVALKTEHYWTWTSIQSSLNEETYRNDYPQCHAQTKGRQAEAAVDPSL